MPSLNTPVAESFVTKYPSITERKRVMRVGEKAEEGGEVDRAGNFGVDHLVRLKSKPPLVSGSIGYTRFRQ